MTEKQPAQFREPHPRFDVVTVVHTTPGQQTGSGLNSVLLSLASPVADPRRRELETDTEGTGATMFR